MQKRSTGEQARERTLGADHPDTLASVNNLAICFKARGQLKDAEALYRRDLEASERTLGAEHPETLTSVNNLAICLQAMGQLKDAEVLHRRALEARERTLGADHPDTLPQGEGKPLSYSILWVPQHVQEVVAMNRNGIASNASAEKGDPAVITQCPDMI